MDGITWKENESASIYKMLPDNNMGVVITQNPLE